MNGAIFITRTGYDPEFGKHVKDPYLGDVPTLGGCRPDIRKRMAIGDYIFTISGRVRRFPQFVMGGFEVASKLSAVDAYRTFPERRLKELKDHQLDGNIIVDSKGRQHPLDQHRSDTFNQRTQNYIVGRNPVVLTTSEEILKGREETVSVLSEIFDMDGEIPIDIVTRFGRKMNEDQVEALLSWLRSVKHVRSRRKLSTRTVLEVQEQNRSRPPLNRKA